MAQTDSEFVEYIVKAIVDNPDDVKVNRTVDELGVLITLSVNALDMGKVIGKEGNTARALRTLMRVLGAKANARLNLKILEPEGGRVEREREGESKQYQPDRKTVQPAKQPPTQSDSIDQVKPIEEEKPTELV